MTNHPVPYTPRRSRSIGPLMRIALLVGGGLALVAAAPTVHAQSADLSVTLADLADPVALGATVTYEIAVRNLGPDAASNLEVVQSLDAGSAFASLAGGGWSCSHSGEASGGSVTCTLVALAASTDADTITVEATAPTTAATLSSTASIASTTTDPDSSNDSSTQTTAVIVAADLAISKVPSPDPVDADETLTYILSVSNLGPSDAANLVVVDDLPSSATYLAATGTDWTCQHNPGLDQVTCTRTALASGATAPDIVVTVTAPCGVTSLDNTASVSSDTPDLNDANDSVTISSEITPVADLSISLSDSPDPVRARETLSYTVAVSNAGPCSATDVEVVQTLPADADYQSASGTGWSCAHSGEATGGTVTCTRATLDVGAAPDIAVATAAPAQPGDVTSTAAVSATSADPDDTDDSDSETTTVTAKADLVVTTSDGATTAVPGQTRLTYTITVTNDGPSHVTGATFTDELPTALLSPVWTCEITSGSGACSPLGGAGDLSSSLDLESGAVATFTLAAWVAADATGAVANSASVASDVYDPDDANNTATDDDTVLSPSVALTVSKSNDLDGVGLGQSFTYRIRVANAGPSDSATVALSDTYPSQLEAHLQNCTGSVPCWECAPTGPLTFRDREVKGGTVNGLEGASSVAVSPDGAHVYTTGAADDGVGTFSRAADGSLTFVEFDSGLAGAAGVAVSPDGATVYVAAADADSVSAFVRSPATGALTLLDTEIDTVDGVDGLGGAAAVAVSPDGAHVYVAGAADGKVAAFSRAADGSLSFLHAAATSLGGAVALAFSPDGDHLYVAAQTADRVVALLRDHDPASSDFGRLTSVGAFPSTGLDGVRGVAVSPDGAHVYAAAAGSSSLLVAFSRAGDGSLSELARYGESVAGAYGVTVTSDGTQVVVAARTGNAATVYARDPAAGTLTFLGTANDAAVDGLGGARAVAASPTGSHLYVVGETDNAVVAFDLSGGGSCPKSGDGDLALTGLVVPAGGALDVDVHARVKADASGANPVCNTATVPGASPESAEDCDPIVLVADLVLVKDDGAATAVPGTSHGYTITVTNNGSLTVSGATVTDSFPIWNGTTVTAGFATGTVSWQCVPSVGACCASGTATCGSAQSPYTGSGSISQLVDLAAGASLTFTATGTLDPRATGTLSNQALVTAPSTIVDPDPANNSDTDTTVLEPRADLSVQKRHSPPLDTTVSYTISVANAGPSATVGATVQDTFPVGLSAVTWTCSASSGASCSAAGSGDIADTVSLPAGGNVTYTATGTTVDPPPDPVLVNTASVSGGNAVDPSPANNSSTDRLTLRATADLLISKSDGRVEAVRGEPLTYVISVANAGPDNVPGATVVDVFSDDLTDVAWTCSAVPPIPGGLTPVELQALAGAVATVVSPDGAHVYAVGSTAATAGRLVGFSRETDATSHLYGKLGFIEAFERDDTVRLGGAAALALSPDGSHLYVAAAGDNAVLVFDRDQLPGSTDYGTLTFSAALVDGAGGVGGVAGARALAVSPDGRHLYVAGAADSALAVFERNTTTGALSFLDTVVDGAGGVDGLAGASGVVLSAGGEYLYATGADDDAVAVFSRDASTGQLTFVEVAVDGMGGADGLAGAAALALSPDGAQLYVAGADDDAVASFSRHPVDGTLTFALSYGAGIDGLDGVGGVAVSPDGQHLVAAGTLADRLVVFRRNTSTGLLTFQEVLIDNTPATGTSPAVDGLDGVGAVAFSPDPDGSGPNGGGHVYTAAAGDGAVGVFSRRQPDPGFAFIEVERDGVDDTGDTGGPVDGLYGARAAAVAPDGRHLYAAGFGDNALAVFSRDQSQGSTEATRPLHLSFVQAQKDGVGGVDGLAGATAVVVSSDNRHVYAAGQNDNAVAAFTRNQTSGALTFLEVRKDGVGGVDGLAGASGLALSADGATLYVAGQYDSAVAVFRRETDGRLTFLERKVNGAEGVEGLAGVTAVAVSPDGTHVYAASRVADSVVVFRRALDGRLSFQQALYDGVGSDGLDQAQSVRVSPDGAQVYVAAGADDAIAVFRRDTDNTSGTFGSLVPLAVYRNGVGGVSGLDGVRSVALSPDGANVYAAGENDGTLVIFARVTNASSSEFGALTPVEVRSDGVDGVDGLRQAWGLAVSADSRHVYVASLGDSAVAAFVRRSGSSCSASGTGDIVDVVDLGFGGSISYTVTATVRPGAVGDASNGSLINTATVTPPGGITDDDPTNNVAVDVDALRRRADVAVAKSDGRSSVNAGDPVTYTITVTNAGPSNEVGALVTDAFSPELLGPTWSCLAIGSGTLDQLEVQADGIDGVTGLDGASAVTLSPDPDGALGPLPGDTHLYATGLGSGSVVVFERDGSSGTLAFVEEVSDGAGALAGASDLALNRDPDAGGPLLGGTHLYATGQIGDGIAVFGRDPVDGTLSVLQVLRDGQIPAGGGIPVDGLDQAVAVAISADGTSVYVAGANDDAVAVFGRDPATGLLGYLGVVRDGSGDVDGIDGASDLALSPDDAYLYVSGFNDGAVAVFARDPGDGSLSFIERKGSASTTGLAGASAVALDLAGQHVYVAGALDDAVVVFARDAATGRLTPLQVVADGEDDVLGLDGPVALACSPAGGYVYAASQAADTIVVLRRDPATGRLTFVERLRDDERADALDGVTDLTLSDDGHNLYSAALADDAVTAFTRPGDSTCPASGVGNLSQVVDIAAGGRLEFTVDATLASGAAGVTCPSPLDPARSCLVNQAAVAVAPTDLGDPDPGDNTSTDADYLARRADLAITKDDGLAAYDGLLGAVDLAVSPDAGDHVYVAAPDDDAIGIFERSTSGPEFGRLHFRAAVRDGENGVDGLSGVTALVMSGGGEHLYAAAPGDNAVAVFERDPITGGLSLSQIVRHGLAGVTGMLGASSLALSPDGAHLYVTGRDSDAVVILARDHDPGSSQYGLLTFVNAVTSASGAQGLTGPSAVAVTGDGRHVLAASPLGSSITVFGRDDDSGSATFGRLTYLEVHVDGVGGVDGLAGVSALALTSDGSHLYVASPDSSAVSLFTRDDDPTSPDFGRLSFTAVARDGQGGFDGLAGAKGLLLAPGEGHLYVAGAAADAVAQLHRDPATGALSPAAVVRDGDLQSGNTTVVVQGLDGPAALATDPAGEHLYVAAAGSDALTGFDREPVDGALTYLESFADGGGGAPPGSAVTYTIVVTNNGPSDVVDAVVRDTLPTEFESIAWQCSPVGNGAACERSSGSGDLDETIDLPVGTRVIFAVTGSLRTGVTGTLTNTAMVNEPPGVVDPDRSNNSATDDDTILAAVVRLSLTKDDGLVAVAPGQQVSYHIAVANAGPSHAGSATVEDNLPEALGGAAWTCAASPPPGLLRFVDSAQNGVNGVTGLAGAADLAVTGDGRHVYAVGQSEAAVVVLERNPSNGGLAFVASFFDGSGGFDGLAGATAVAVSPDDGHVYVAGEIDDAVAVLARDAATGELSFVELERDGLAGVNGLGGIRDLAVSPDGAHLYAAGSADNAVAIFSRSSATGALTFAGVRINGSGGVSGLAGASALAMSPAGDHLYVAGEAANAVAVFTRNAATGALTFVEVELDGVGDLPAGALTGPLDLAVSRDGRWLWVAATGSGTVATFSRNASTGALTFVDVVDRDGASGLAVVPDGGQLYVAAASSGTVSAWQVDDGGQLALLASYDNSTALFSGLGGARRLTVSDDGHHLYVAAASDQAATALARLPGSTCSPVGFGHIVDDVELSAGGSLLYTLTATVSAAAAGTVANTAVVRPGANLLDPDLADNTDTDTDLLASVADLAISKTDGLDAAVAGTTTSYTVTVTNLGPSDVLGATVSDPAPLFPADPAGLAPGSLAWTCVAPRTLVPASVVHDGDPDVDRLDGAGAVVVDPDLDGPAGEPGGRHVYVASALDDSVTAFARDPVAGTLTVIGAVADGVDDCDGLDGAAALAISPDGRHLYVAAATESAVAVLARDPVSGAPSCVQALLQGNGVDGLAGATGVAVSPDGAHVYAVGRDSDAVVVFARDADSGELVFVERKKDGLADVPLLTLDGARDVLVAPDGRHLYVASQNADAVATFHRDPETGRLTFADVVRNLDLQGETTVHGLDLVRGLAASPDGDLVYAVSLGDDAVVVFARDPASGALAFLEAQVDGSGAVDGLDGASDVTASPDGAYLYVAGLNDDAVATFKRDWLTSRLVFLGVERDGAAGFDGLDGVTGLAATPDGGHLLVAGSMDDSVAAFARQAEGDCAPAGAGDQLLDTVDLAAGASLTFVVSGQIHPSAQGTLENVAAVVAPPASADPEPLNNVAHDATTVEVVTDIAVAKTDGVQTAVAGLPLTYTVTLVNGGPSDAYGLAVFDALPAPLLAAGWTCHLMSDAGVDMGSCGAGAGSLAENLDLPSAWSALYTITGTLDPGALGPLSNTASVTVTTGTDPVAANDSATDVDAVVQIADVITGKSNGLTAVVPGTAVTYTVTVTNAGPSHSLQTRVQDTLPPQLVAPVGWTCSPAGGATCTASGTGSIDQVVSLPTGSSVVYTIAGTVNPAALGTIANTASAQTLGGVSDPTLANNLAADSDPLTPIADVSLATVDSPDPVVTGYPLTYTLTASNLGPSNADTVVVSDSLPAGLTLTGTVGCAEDGSGGGVPLCTLGPIPAGASDQYQIQVVVSEGVLGQLVNTAVASSLTDDPVAANNTSTVTTTSVPWADLALAKTDSPDPAVAGTELVYTLTVSNPGPYDASAVTVTESLPSGVTPVATTGCAEDPNGVPVCTLGTVPAGQSRQYSLAVLVDSGSLGDLVNQATAAAATFDPTTADNAAVATTQVTAVADLWATKDNGVGWLELGQQVTYTLVIGNDGPSDVPSASVADEVPPELIATEWTCVATGAAFCSPAGTGNLLLDTVELPAGTLVTYTVDTTLDAATPLPATVVNTVAVAADDGETDPDPGDNAATDVDQVEDTRIFLDGFESGDFSAWSSVVPPPESTP